MEVRTYIVGLLTILLSRYCSQKGNLQGTKNQPKRDIPRLCQTYLCGKRPCACCCVSVGFLSKIKHLLLVVRFLGARFLGWSL